METRSGLNSLKDTNLRAWTPSMARLYDVELGSGRHMTDNDYQSAAPVCVIGWDLVENLMPGVDPLGKEVHFENNVCQVIGVGKKVGTVLGQSRDNWIIIALTAYRKSYGTQDSVRITCRTADAARIETVLIRRHDIFVSTALARFIELARDHLTNPARSRRGKERAISRGARPTSATQVTPLKIKRA
jgi:hypothetical protein